MKISKLIDKLNDILSKEGDLDVTCWPYDGQGRDFDLEQVDVYDRPEYIHYNNPGYNRKAKRIVNLDV